MLALLGEVSLRHLTAYLLLGVILQAGIVALAALVLRHFTHKESLGAARPRLAALAWHDMDAVWLLVMFIGTQVIAALLSPTLARLLIPAGDSLEAFTFALQTILLPIMGMLTIAVMARARGIPRGALVAPAQGGGWLRTLAIGGLYYLATMPFLAATTYGYTALLNALNYPVGRQSVVDVLLDASQPQWLRFQIMALAVTLVPTIEEFLFRGVFLPIALRHATPLRAIAGTAFIFAALHMHIPSLGPLFVLGCAFSVAYLQTGSLAVPIVMHALFNGVSIISMLLLGDAPELLLR